MKQATEATKEIATERIADQCANDRPSFHPRKPASAAPTRGEKAAINDNVIKLILVSSAFPWFLPSTPDPQPFKLPRSSTLIDRRFLKSATRIARPMADSAAATVRMKNTNTWPARSPL